MSNYYSFDELRDELGMSDDEIKKMVSEGELRAFKEEDTMKFKREDVEALKRSRGAAEPAGGFDDDIILLDDDDLGGDPAPAPAPAGDLTEELVLEDDDDFGVGTEALDTQDTFVEGDIGGVTEPIEVIDDDEEEEAMPAPAATASRRQAASRRSRTSVAQAAPAAPAPGAIAPWVAVIQLLLCVVLLFGGALVYGLVTGSNPGATKWLTDTMYEKFAKAKPEVRDLGDD